MPSMKPKAPSGKRKMAMPQPTMQQKAKMPMGVKKPTIKKTPFKYSS